jgi:integrase/recombinase XerD
MERVPPKEMAMKLAGKLRSQRPDYQYLKSVFFYTRRILEVTPEKKKKLLPELLTDEELQAFYEAVFSARRTGWYPINRC